MSLQRFKHFLRWKQPRPENISVARWNAMLRHWNKQWHWYGAEASVRD